MAETLTELVAKISTDAAGLKSGLSDAEKQTEASSKKMQDSLKKVGMVMAASGAAITAALGLMGKAALDEEINIKRLATTINNSGTAYDNVKDSLEAVIAATQRKTGVADDEQRDILNRLILVTNDYGKAMELLPTVLDLAAAGEMDATTAATYLGKAYLELEEGADEVSVRFGQASLQFKNMEDIQNRVAGSAENLANPLSVLKASIGDIAEVIGSNLIPIIKGATDKIVDIAIKVQDWANEHPALAKTLTIVTTALGVLLTVAGGLILILPTLTAGVAAFGVVLGAVTWPITLIVAGIGLLIAGGILLWQNWDKVTKFISEAWNNVKIVLLSGVDIMLKGLEKFLGWIPGIGDKIRSARESIGNMINSEKVKKDIREVQKSTEELTATVTAEYEKQRAEIAKRYDAERADAKKAFDTAVDLINKEYGIAEDAADKTKKTRIDKAKEATAALKEEYKKEQDAATTRYNNEIRELEAVYNKKIKSMNAEADAQTKALQQQIDAIDNQTAKEDLALTRAAEKQKLLDLKSAIDSAETDEDTAAATKAYAEYETQVKRNELLRQRADEKDQLRDEIQNIRDSLQNERNKLAEELEADKTAAKLKTDTRIDELDRLSKAEEAALVETLARIETDRLAALKAETDKFNAETTRINDTELAEITFFTDQLKRTNDQIEDINLAYNNLTKRYDIEIVTHHIDEYSSSGSGGGGSSSKSTPQPAFSAASGGIVPGAIGQPVLATVHGGETIIPANDSMGVTVNISGPLFMEREDQMNQLVDKIRKGIDRSQRLRFGGAYSG